MLKKFYRTVMPRVIRSKVNTLRVRMSRIISPNQSSTFEGDGFSTTHFLGFRTDAKFNAAFASAVKSVPKDASITHKHLESIEWRAHITTWAANQALRNKEERGGDFVECGVWYGVLSKTICEYLNMKEFKDRKFYLVDTFGSMPGSHSSLDYQKDIYQNVKDRFSNYPAVQLIRGVVPECLSEIKSSRIAYLAIDMNSSQPELATLEYFYDKMVRGGVIYFDDYGWGYPELRKVVDQFFSDKPETLLHFPSGNSIVIKI